MIKNRILKTAITSIISVCMILAFLPVNLGNAHGVTTAGAKDKEMTPASDITTTANEKDESTETEEETVQYAICTWEKNVETGEKELTLSGDSEEESYAAYIGQTKEFVLAAKSDEGTWTALTDTQAADYGVTWSVTSGKDLVEDCDAVADSENSKKTAGAKSKTTKKSTATKKYKMLAETTDEIVNISVTGLVPAKKKTGTDSSDSSALSSASSALSSASSASDSDSQAISTAASGTEFSYTFYMEIYDGYNPGFDPDDEDECISIIKNAESKKEGEPGAVITLEEGEQVPGDITENDGYLVFRFKAKKSRFYDFASVNSGDTCAYLYCYDSEPPTEIGKSETCDMVWSDEEGEGDFSITGDDYKNPLDESFATTAYYLIVKYYRSSATGTITVSCEIPTYGGIYDAHLTYKINGESIEGDETDAADADDVVIDEYKEFTYSDKDLLYVTEALIPYNFVREYGISLSYLDSNEKLRTKDGLTEGRNMVTVTGGNTYVIDLTYEQGSDLDFDASIYRYTESDDWESDTIKASSFDENNCAVIGLPRNCAGKEYTLRIECVGSSVASCNKGNEECILEIPFTATEEAGEISFNVKSADGMTSEEYTVRYEENQPVGIDNIYMEFDGYTAPGTSTPEKNTQNRIYGSEFDESGNAIVYVPSWFGNYETRNLDTDIVLLDDSLETSFTTAGALNAINEAIAQGKDQDYTFTINDIKSKTRYSMDYTITFRVSSGKVAGLKSADISWLDSDTEETLSQKISFLSGEGTKKNPKTASVRLPEGVTITNSYFETEIIAFAKECGTVYSYDDGYQEETTFMEYALESDTKSKKVLFKIVSEDRSKSVYYAVNVYDSDQPFVKGTLFKSEGGVYKVTKAAHKNSKSVKTAGILTGISGKTAGTSAAEYGALTYVKPVSGETAAEIPTTITENYGSWNYKVTAVAAKAFKGNKTVKIVTVGAGVTKIGADALSGATKVKTLKIGSAKLTKSGVKNSLRGSSVKTVKCTGKAAAKVKAYRKYFTKSNCGRTVKVTK